jgi:hypothetical protein
MFWNTLQRFFRNADRARRTPIRSDRFSRLRLESLETRLAPATAIFTSDITGVVNANQYETKTDVYLDGGPGHTGLGTSLEVGEYAIRVVQTAGNVVIGSSLTVTGAEYPVKVLFGDHDNDALTPDQNYFEDLYQVYSIVRRTSTPGAGVANGYDDSSNGVYRLEISTPLADGGTFGAGSKSDNFKVEEGDGPGPGILSISGQKYYDTNADGNKDVGEVGINGFVIKLYFDSNSNNMLDDGDDLVDATTTSTIGDTVGAYAFPGLVAGTYFVREIIPTGGDHVWIQTSENPASTVIPTSKTNIDFGNVCLGEGGGLTQGFWSNRNGKNVFNTESESTGLTGLQVVNSLNLRGADGNLVADFANYDAFRAWLKDGESNDNMAYKLSIQLAAMALNVNYGYVDADAIVYAPDCGDDELNPNGNWITIGDLITKANAELLAANGGLEYQECLKDALDNANNNYTFVQAEPCEVIYTEEDLLGIPL